MSPIAPLWILSTGLHVLALVTALRAAHHAELQLLGLLRRGHEAAHAYRICTEGLLAKDVLFGVNGRFEVLRPIAGRSCEHHDIDVGRDHLPECVEPRELMFGIDLDAAGDLGVIAQPLQVGGDVILKDVANGDEIDVFRAGDHVDDSLATAAAEANEAGFQFRFARAAHELRTDNLERRRGCAGDGRFL